MTTPAARDLPYREVDFITGMPDYTAGNAMLGELTDVWADRQAGLGRMSTERAKAISEAAAALQRDQLEEMLAPSLDLHGITVKLAMAMRLGWDRLAGDEGWGPASTMKLLGIVLADLVLFREAEMQRRHETGEVPAP